MANRRFIDFPIAASVGDNDIVLIWQDGLNKQTTKATLLQGSPQSLAGLTDVDISALNNGQILQYNSTTSKWENVDRTDINLSELGDVTIVAPSNGQVLVYNSSTSKWENSSGGYVPYTGAVTTVNLGAQSILAGSFVKAGGTAAQFLKANGSVDSTAYGTGSVTSVGLTMPSAFNVANSPVTTAGTLAVTGAGTVGQYIRGDGSLADFPATTGGGSSVSYYLNGSVSQGTIGGVAYKELNRTPIFGAGTDITINADGYIASFITDAGDPNKLLIPAGNWNFETYFSASSSGGSPSFYVELYKYNGTTFTLIASSSTAPELIAFGTNLNPYYSTLAVPETVLALTDRLALRYYVTHSGRTITLHTENGHLCEVITTFTTGLTALNGLTNQVQFFAVGTAGTDFAISSVTDTHTFNLPTASATNRGALSSADWTTFNNKTSNLGTVTSVGLSSATSGVTIGSTPITTSGTITLAIATASASQNGLLSSTDWTTFNGKQNALTNPVTGTGTSNTLAKFTGSTTIGNSLFTDNGTNAGYNNAGVAARTFIIQATSGRPLALEVIENANVHAIYLYPNNSGFNRISSDYMSGGVFLPLSLTGRENNADLVLHTNGNVTIGTTNNDVYKLDVNGTGRYNQNNTSVGNATGIRLEQAGSGDIAISYLLSGVREWLMGVDNSDSDSFKINNITGSSDFSNVGVSIATTGAATFSSSVSTSNEYYVSGTGQNAFKINSTGTFYGMIQNTSADKWSLAYGINGAGNTALGTSVLTWTGGGNVGIGTASPTDYSSGGFTTLHINGRSGTGGGVLRLTSFDTTCGVNIYAQSNAVVFNTTTASPYAWLIQDSTKMTLNTSGNLGIGVSPSSWDTGNTVKAVEISQGALWGYSTTNIYLASNYYWSGSNRIYLKTAAAAEYSITNGNHEWFTSASGTAGNAVTLNHVMTITSVGRGLFGTQTASAGAGGFNSKSFHVNSEVVSMGSNAGFFWENRSGGVTSSANWYGWYTSGGTIFLYNGSSNIASINSTSGVYTPLSDKNKKKDFEKSTLGLNEILNLKPTLYRMNSDSEDVKKQLGFLAQEVKEYIPQAYVESEDFIGLNYNSIIPVLVNAIKELNDKIK